MQRADKEMTFESHTNDETDNHGSFSKITYLRY